jgi:hypothetical protein
VTDEASAEGISPVPEQWLRVGFSGAGSKERLLFASSTVSRICAAGGIDRSLDRALQIRRLSRVSRSAEGAGNASRKPDLHCPGSRGNARAPVKPIGLRVTKSWRGYLGARECCGAWNNTNGSGILQFSSVNANDPDPRSQSSDAGALPPYSTQGLLCDP